jgi:hypothetical protein
MITVFVLSIISLIHPFHVSVTDIKYKEEKKSMQISTRIFLDDLELALRSYSGNEKLDIVAQAQTDSVQETLEQYLLEKVKLWDEKGREYSLSYVGSEIEEDVMWCYLEIEKVKKFKQIKMRNSLLHEVWSDQENLVHFRAFEQVKSARLVRGEDTATFSWE